VFDIEASIDLQDSLNLGIVNGVIQFDDTNAANFPARFYYTNPR
jgi:hypothetical protein